ncbi:MAG: hypothetical protein ACRDL8_04515, partial [Solirubrobacteraceae bacterium]
MRRYRLLARAFPRVWRKVYGEELLRLLSEQPRRGQCVDLVCAGVRERCHQFSRRARSQVVTVYRLPAVSSVVV